MISAIAVAFVLLGTPAPPVLTQDAIEAPGEETLFAYLPPFAWAQVISKADERSTRTEDISPVTCAGLETTYMLCAWEQRVDGEWLKLFQYADISQVDGLPIRLIGERQADPDDQ